MEYNINKLKEEVSYIEKNKMCSEKKYEVGAKASKKVKAALADLDEFHNHSWAIEIFNKNIDKLDNIALQYRTHNITYREMFEEAYIYAKSLKQLGYKKGSEIPICITNIPEFVYLFLAASFIGAKVNVVSDWFDKDYLTEIFNKTESKTIFVDDLSYEAIKKSIDKSNIENIVMVSLSDSLPKDKSGKSYNPYEELEKKFHTIKNRVKEYQETSSKKIHDIEAFKLFGKDYSGRILDFVDLDDILTITYTSGTTSPGRPKGVKQANRSYISLARNYEPDVSSNQEMKDMKFLGHIATDTHISLSCGISDTLYCSCTYDCEPFYSMEFFPYALLINKSNFVTASVGFWGYLSKLLNNDPAWKKVNLPFLMLPTVTGEGCSKGEEKYFNYTSRNHKFGTAKLPFPISPVAFSIGGGTTEGTGIFVTLFKALQEKLPNNLTKKEGLGLMPLTFSEVEVLNKDLDYCKVGEPGILVEKSPCEMVGYVDEELNKKTRITDKYGKNWLNLGVYSYKSDKEGRIKMKGRMKDNITLSDGKEYPLYLLEDCILSDTKNIMSCSVINLEDTYVCHIEYQPTTKKNKNAILKSIYDRITKFVPAEILEKVSIRIRSFEESYPLDPSGKRSSSTLKRIGLDEKCISYDTLTNMYKEKSNTKVRKLIK